MAKNAVDITGMTFGHLVVIGRAPSMAGTKSTKAHWECHCACGRPVIARGDNLRQGRSKSCGECNAIHTRALSGSTARWQMEIWAGDRMKMPSGGMSVYAFGVLREPATGELAVPLTKYPILCDDPRTHPLKPAFDAGKITSMKENRPTILRWLEEERIVVMTVNPYSSRLEVIREWERVSGLTHPDRAWMEHAARARRNDLGEIEINPQPAINDIAPAQALMRWTGSNVA